MASNLAQKIRNVGRLTQIVNILARYGFKKELQKTELVDFLATDVSQGEIKGDIQNQSLTRARRLRMAFEELGPTFIKLGQLLAAREDLLPRNYVVEFKRLQDRAKPFSNDTLEQILAVEFQGKHNEYFEHIERTPIGAASIGQVHEARLRNGALVVLKIQRPEMEALIRTDLSILMGIAHMFEGAIPELKLLRPTVVVEELKKSLHAELDYFREATSTERMRVFFEGHEKIYIPQIFREFCTRRVLCMEAIHGTKLTNLNHSPEHGELVRIGVQAFLDMTFKFGIFHADLHPGNFILMENGRLAILDFGLTARLTREMRNTMSFMFLALMNEDMETFARLFIELTDAHNDADRSALETEIRDSVDAAMSLPVKDLQIGKVLMQVARISAAKGAPVSRELVLFFRALIALESFGRALDPSFQVLKEATDYAKKMPQASLVNKMFFEQDSLLLLRDSQALLKELPLTLRILSKRLQTGQFTLKVNSDELTQLSKEVHRAGRSLSTSIVIAAVLLSISLLMYGQKSAELNSLLSFKVLMGITGVALIIGFILSVSRMGRSK